MATSISHRVFYSRYSYVKLRGFVGVGLDELYPNDDLLILLCLVTDHSNEEMSIIL